MHQPPSIPDQALTACPPCTVDPVLRSRAGSFLAFGPGRLVVGLMLCLERPDNTGKSPALALDRPGFGSHFCHLKIGVTEESCLVQLL